MIGRGLTLQEALSHVATGRNIMCKDETAALTIVGLIGYRNAVGPEIGVGHGYYWHYHPHRNTHTHIWFYGVPLSKFPEANGGHHNEAIY